MVKVSIIVPVYNTQKYIKRCLDSLVFQDLEDIEIILVDDCSTDNSVIIIQEYIKKFKKNIKLLKNEKNSGAATSRKHGFSNACGEYVMFVDADDWIELNTCSLLYQRAKHGNFDIVYSDFDRVDKNNKTKERGLLSKCFFRLEGELTKEKRRVLSINDGASYWGRIYKRDWWIESGFSFMENGRFDEDDVEILLSLKAHRIGVVDKILYHWFINDESVTYSRKAHFTERYNCAKFVLDEAKRLNLYEDYKEELEYCFIRSFILNNINAFNNLLEYDAIINEDLEKLISYVQKCNMSFKHNRYYQILEKKEMKLLAEALTSKEHFEAAYYSQYKNYYIIGKERVESLGKYIVDNDLNVVLWGAGKKTRTFAKLYPEFLKNIMYIVDSNQSFAGAKLEKKYLIQTKEKIDNDTDMIIVMNHNHVANVAEQVKGDFEILDMDYYLCYGIGNL